MLPNILLVKARFYCNLTNEKFILFLLLECLNSSGKKHMYTLRLFAYAITQTTYILLPASKDTAKAKPKLF